MTTAELIRRLLARRARVENRAAADQLALLRETRREVIAELLGPHSRFDDWRFRGMLKVIDAMIDRQAAKSGVVVAKSVRESWEVGLEFGSVGIPNGFIYGVSSDLLGALEAVTKESLNDVWLDAGRAVKLAVRRAALGVQSPGESIRRLAQTLRNHKTFGSVEVRAEMIVRTEVNRTFAMAADAQMGSAAAAMKKGGLELRKYWLSADDTRVREAHQNAAEKYDKAHAIPESSPFIVDGEPLMYPLDPAGSASNTIGCRCVSVPVVVED